MIRAGLLALWFLVGEVQMAGAQETVQQRIDSLLPASQLYLPDGAGPFPVVIQLHGCGGPKKLQAAWAPVAREAGWAVIVVDSYAYRKISTVEAYLTVCLGLRLWGRERAGDLFAMMEWARRQGWADPTRIAVAGWSHGGWTAMDAMALKPGEESARETHLADIPVEPLSGLVGAFLFYPYSGLGSLSVERGMRADVSVEAIVGARDSVVGGRSNGRRLAQVAKPGSPVNVTVFETATHAFDEAENHDIRMSYDPVLTERARQMYRDFLKAAATRRSPL
jgi:dienelactone hydrolase